MSLDITKLEDVEKRGSRTIARCPACAEQGHDNKGNHLLIDEQGRFSCIMHPGEGGHQHRKRIFSLVGNNDAVARTCSMRHDKMIKVKAVNKNTGIVLKKNVLGRLGRVNQTHAYREKDTKDNIYNKDIKKGVPSVPDVEEKPIYTPDEIEKLTGSSGEAMSAIDMIKKYFPGSTVVDVQPNESDLGK
jgi:hypothetical protein